MWAYKEIREVTANMDQCYIDMHTHIIPGVDDGAQNLEVALQMLQIAYGNGIRICITTPHFYGRKRFDQELVEKQFQLLSEEAKKKYPDMEFYLGNEMYYECLQEDLIEEQVVNTLANSRYVLIEFSYTISYRSIYQKARDMILNGYIPIIAHIERYQCMRNLDNVAELIKLGCYVQINSSSLGGGMFDRTASYVKKLLEHHMVHFVATDSHNTSTRKPELQKAIRVIRKIGGEDMVTQLLYENPMKIINNVYI